MKNYHHKKNKTYRNINKSARVKKLEKKLRREQRCLSRKYENLKKEIYMKAAINKILENKNNIGLDFVVHVRNEKELNDLIDVLMKHNFCIQLSFEFSPEQIDLWMRDIAKEDGYDLCFRIRNRENDKCVAYNPSVEHWRLFCNNILEMNNGELEFNEGKYSLQDARIEANKLYKDMKDDSATLDLFELDTNADDKDIINKIVSLVGFSKEELF